MSPAPSFDRRTSLHLDALVLQLEAQPHPLRRAWLRLSKRVVERRIPAAKVRYASR